MSAFMHYSTINARRITLTAAALIAAAGSVAAASDHRRVDANRYYGLYEHRSVSVYRSVGDPQIHPAAIIDLSGTGGREGLGTSPLYPEGPGDVVD